MKNKDVLREHSIAQLPIEIYGKLEQEVYKESLVSVLHYFNGGGNGPEAKIAVATLGNLAKREQATNNRKSIELVANKLQLEGTIQKIDA